jgi:hypothetical protein
MLQARNPTVSVVLTISAARREDVKWRRLQEGVMQDGGGGGGGSSLKTVRSHGLDLSPILAKLNFTCSAKAS